ncbi:iron-containing alcohol dehydrogenase, partial [Romboutsia ilealis]|nr:iron-containing alcohol dehydrogenase [Romboutsia ilealis]
NKAFPLVLIPTTAGTGAENTLYGVISCTETGRKRVVCEVGSLTILDPELAYGLPADITAYTGIDAFSHIVEGMTCNVLNPLTDAL